MGWDSKKEYDKFWGKDRKRKRIKVAIAMILLVFAVFFILYRLFSFKSFDSEEMYSHSIVESNPALIPDYDGTIFVELNNNRPCFNSFDYNHISGEHYTELDEKGRCGVALAMLDNTMMPSEDRGYIGDIKPSGWNQEKYPGIVESEPPYLYNRCHLIAYALTGQNANELNLITGTRYFNVVGMLPFEEMVMRYLEQTDNHVLYRVSPYFVEDELVARGVEMEAYSIEDEGEGINYHVFVYNIQPNVKIDYKTGKSCVEQ